MEPSWQKIKLIKLVATDGPLWTLVRDYVPVSRLLRFTVADKNESQAQVATTWCPVGKTTCGANGIVTTTSKAGLLTNGALYGALIGKLGGSSADIPDTSAVGSPYGTKRVFAIGSYCVIALGNADAGPLFLTMNDAPGGFADHSGELHVLLEEYAT